MSHAAWQIFTNEYPSLYPVSPISRLCLSSAYAYMWAAWHMNDNEDDGNSNHPSLTHSLLSLYHLDFFLLNVAEDEILSCTDCICRIGLCQPQRDSFLICISEKNTSYVLKNIYENI